uniref:Uncharacterized protein n=1 Tax=Rhizophora mucronata TaxID=61149 RepID=A0A2P2QA81_RHIMU
MDQWPSELNIMQKLQDLDVFLDMLCFFNREHKDVGRDILDGCRFFTDRTFTSGVVMDKAMISISNDILLVYYKGVGCEIVKQGSKLLGDCSRLWDHEDVCHVLTSNSVRPNA